MARFGNDKPKLCNYCGAWIYPGKKYFELEGSIACADVDCMRLLVWDTFNGMLEEKHVLTGEEKEYIHADDYT